MEQPAWQLQRFNLDEVLLFPTRFPSATMMDGNGRKRTTTDGDNDERSGCRVGPNDVWEGLRVSSSKAVGDFASHCVAGQRLQLWLVCRNAQRSSQSLFSSQLSRFLGACSCLFPVSLLWLQEQSEERRHRNSGLYLLRSWFS